MDYLLQQLLRLEQTPLAKNNPTKARAHLVHQCPGVDMDTKHHLLQGSQSSGCSSALYALSLDTMDTVADIREHAVQALPRVVSLTLTHPPSQASIFSIISRLVCLIH